MLNYTLTGFADEISPDLNIQMDVLDALDIHYIEMRGVDGRNLCDYPLSEAASVKKRLDERGFALSAIGSPLGKIPVTDPFEPHYEKFLHACDLAELFETPNIRIFSFYIPDGEDPDSYRDEVLRRLSAMVREAQRRGLVLHVRAQIVPCRGHLALAQIDLVGNGFMLHGLPLLSLVRGGGKQKIPSPQSVLLGQDAKKPILWCHPA